MGPDKTPRSEPLEFCKRLGTTLLISALLVVCAAVTPSRADDCACTPCHGTLEEVHGDFNHSASLGSGQVAVFADTDHDDAGWVGDRPFFAVTVECAICHHNDLPAVHGRDCATCHPTPYDTLGIWGKGCQQGGCHPFIHEDSTKAHLPYENSHDYTGNDCNICHGMNFAVQQTNCLNCHATYRTGDVTPPATATDALAEYIGPARIGFSVTDDGKVAVGRTFYRLDGGTSAAAGKYVFITDPGSHQLEFWSMDQAGNTEQAPNNVFFNIVADTTAPTTTTNAKSSYNQGALITLTATDDSTLGVKTTWYRVNDGPFQAGTGVAIPAASGAFDYALTFYSEDWSGNIESQKSVSFTVTSGNGTLRLVWGDSDLSGSPCAGDPQAEASWTIRKGSWWGEVFASGSAGCPNWSGFNDVAVPVGSTYYFVVVDWWDSYNGYDDQTIFPNIQVTTPGEVIPLRY